MVQSKMGVSPKVVVTFHLYSTTSRQTKKNPSDGGEAYASVEHTPLLPLRIPPLVASRQQGTWDLPKNTHFQLEEMFF